MITPHGAMPELPNMPSNISHVTRRIRACESEVPAQLVLEHAMREYARAAIQQAAAQAVQAVPGWKLVPICLTPDMRVELLNAHGLATSELYMMLLAAAPQPPAPVARLPLTRDEIFDLPCGINDGSQFWLFGFARAIEAAHGIGNAPRPEAPTGQINPDSAPVAQGKEAGA